MRPPRCPDVRIGGAEESDGRRPAGSGQVGNARIIAQIEGGLTKKCGQFAKAPVLYEEKGGAAQVRLEMLDSVGIRGSLNQADAQILLIRQFVDDTQPASQ